MHPCTDEASPGHHTGGETSLLPHDSLVKYPYHLPGISPSGDLLKLLSNFADCKGNQYELPFGSLKRYHKAAELLAILITNTPMTVHITLTVPTLDKIRQFLYALK
jgi:hypothetical protein